MIDKSVLSVLQMSLKMVRYKEWTEKEWKSSQCPNQKNSKDLQKAWETIAHDHFW